MDRIKVTFSIPYNRERPFTAYRNSETTILIPSESCWNLAGLIVTDSDGNRYKERWSWFVKNVSEYLIFEKIN